MNEKMLLEILQPSLVLFVTTGLLTIASAVVFKNKPIEARPTMWQGFVSAPHYVRAVVIWILSAVGYNVWECISAVRQGANVAIAGAVAFVMVRILAGACILKGHKWPRNVFQICGTLAIAGGILERMTASAHVWTAFSVNLVVNGIVGLVLYALLAMDESVKWRDAVRTARIEKQQ